MATASWDFFGGCVGGRACVPAGHEADDSTQAGSDALQQRPPHERAAQQPQTKEAEPAAAPAPTLPGRLSQALGGCRRRRRTAGADALAAKLAAGGDPATAAKALAFVLRQLPFAAREGPAPVKSARIPRIPPTGRNSGGDDEFAHTRPGIAEEWSAMRAAVDADTCDKLRELRTRVAHLDDHPASAHEPHTQHATTLLRFLRARNMNVELAAALLADALAWRAEFDVDAKLAAWRAEWLEGTSARVKLLRQYDFVKYCGTDRRGCPVYLHLMGQADPVGIARETGQEAVLLHLLRQFEEQTASLRARFLETGRLVPGCVDLYDIGNYAGTPGFLKRGLGMIPLYTGFARVFDRVYPERVGVAFILRAPRLFDVVWRTIYPAIPEATRRKCRLFGPRSAAWLEELGSLVPPESIPSWLRTDDAVTLGDGRSLGGLVPHGAACG